MSSVIGDSLSSDLPEAHKVEEQVPEYVNRCHEISWRIQSALLALEEWLNSNPDEQTKQRRLALYQTGLSHELVSVQVVELSADKCSWTEALHI